MIDWERTKNETGFNKEYFDNHLGSHRKIYAICDNCGYEKWRSFGNYRALCKSCNRKDLCKPPKPKFVSESERFLNGTQIDRILTIEKFGYDPNDLKLKSNRNVICICQDCKKERIIKQSGYRNICHQCSTKGKNNPNYGKHWSDEVKDKISKSLIGKCVGENATFYGHHHTNESKQKLRDTHIGLIPSKETRQKMGDSRRGELNYNYGKSMLETQKIKISCTKQGIDIEDFNGFIKGLRDHVLPEYKCIQLNSRFKGSEGHHIMSGVIVYIPSDLHRFTPHDLKNNKNMKEINELSFNYLMGDY